MMKMKNEDHNKYLRSAELMQKDEKYFSVLREGEAFDSAVAEVQILSNFAFISSEEFVTRTSRKEEAMTLSSKMV